jgi:hypothetical protein
MAESESVDALTEYVVFKEAPSAARVPWLRAVINGALRTSLPSEDVRRAMILAGIMNRVDWFPLIDDETKRILIAAAHQAAS